MFDCSFIPSIATCGQLAVLAGTNAGYLLLTFLPPIIWLLFYLREDEHPEPKRLIILAFIGGMLIAVPTALIQYMAVHISGMSLESLTAAFPLVTFFGMALIEEYAKYFVVLNLIASRGDFDEPIDAMIYLMSAAMGFAAVENALFVFPVFQNGFFSGLELVAGRFLGANLLHVLSSGVLGFFVAKAFLSRFRRSLILLGLLVATVLHTIFNYLILIKGSGTEGFWYILFFLLVLAMIVFTEFERLKRKKVNLIT